MIPQEIRRLAQSFPLIWAAVKRREIWDFLREAKILDTSLRLCIRCEMKKTPAIETDYVPGLCIDCLLHEFVIVGPLLADKYRDPRSRHYDAKYDAECKMWEGFHDGYEGPEMAIG